MTFPQLLDRWTRRFCSEFFQIFLPGLAGLILFDVNFGLFQGEFTVSDMTNVNTLLVYYADKLDMTGTQKIPYYIALFFMVYLLGYFLNASSKYFMGPRRWRMFLRAGEADDNLSMSIPPSVAAKIGAVPGDLAASGGREICQALVESEGLAGELHSLETRAGLYRSLGYLFCLMAVVNVSLFAIAFDFSNLVLKMCIVILNLVFAFLFFKGQEEASNRWKEQLAAEALVAVMRQRS